MQNRQFSHLYEKFTSLVIKFVITFVIATVLVSLAVFSLQIPIFAYLWESVASVFLRQPWVMISLVVVLLSVILSVFTAVLRIKTIQESQDYSPIMIRNGEIISSKKNGTIEGLTSVSGKIIVSSESAVILEKEGKLTTVFGPRVVITDNEVIREIFDLSPQVVMRTLDDVLTRDPIRLTLKVRISYRIKSTPPDNQSATVDSSELFPGHEEILLKAAFGTAENWRDFAQEVVISNLRDQIMAHYFTSLFTIQDSIKYSTETDNRQIKIIEDNVKNTANQITDSVGVEIIDVDISEIHFPERIEEKIKDEVSSLIEVRMQESKAQATVIAARARAQATILQGQGEGEARSAFFREVLRELKREGVLGDEEMVAAVLRQLISTMVSVQDLQTFVKATAFLERSPSKQLEVGSEVVNGNGMGRQRFRKVSR